MLTRILSHQLQHPRAAPTHHPTTNISLLVVGETIVVDGRVEAAVMEDGVVGKAEEEGVVVGIKTTKTTIILVIILRPTGNNKPRNK